MKLVLTKNAPMRRLSSKVLDRFPFYVTISMLIARARRTHVNTTRVIAHYCESQITIIALSINDELRRCGLCDEDVSLTSLLLALSETLHFFAGTHHRQTFSKPRRSSLCKTVTSIRPFFSRVTFGVADANSSAHCIVSLRALTKIFHHFAVS